MYIHNTFGLHIKKRFYGKCFKKYHIVKESMFCEWKYVEICSCILFYCCEFSLCEQSGQLFEILIVDSVNTFGSNRKQILYIRLTTTIKGCLDKALHLCVELRVWWKCFIFLHLSPTKFDRKWPQFRVFWL